MNRKIILNFLKANKSYLYSHYNISKIGLIGSFARNEENDNSDIDICREKYLKPYIRDYIFDEVLYA